MQLGTQQLDTFLLETQVSKGIGNMKETSETWEMFYLVADVEGMHAGIAETRSGGRTYLIKLDFIVLFKIHEKNGN